MAFNYFNSDIGYNGEDLHVIRNGQDFPLKDFFRTQGFTVVFSFKFPGTTLPLNYEDITINVTHDANGDLATATINATSFTGDRILNNFYIEVTINGQTTVILVHIHDHYEEIWTTPNPLTFRRYMRVKFGLYARFHEGVDADISFYPGIACNKLDDDLTALTVDVNSGRIIENTSGTYPTTFPQSYPDSFELVLPPYFRNSVIPYQAKGSVIIDQHAGNMILIDGIKPKKNNPPPPVPEYENAMNILFIADGFDGSSGSDVEKFKEYVTDIRSQMMKEVSSPWNMFHNINFWAYFLKSNEPMGSERGQYLSIGSTSTLNRMIPLQNYVKICDRVIGRLSGPYENAIAGGPAITLDMYIQSVKSEDVYGSEIVNFLGLASLGGSSEFPVLNPAGVSTSKPKILTLSQLCSVVGLPSVYDDGKTLNQKRTEWTTLGFLPSSTYDMIFPGDSPTQPTKYYVTEFVFGLWKKLKDQRVIEMADTYLGLEKAYDSRDFDNRVVTSVEYRLGNLKFANYVDFNRMISHYQYTDSASVVHDLGLQFFEENGTPVFTVYDIRENIGDLQVTYKDIKNGNNIVLLSKLYKLELHGLNTSFTNSSTIDNVKTTYTLHKAIIPVRKKTANFTPCTIVPADLVLEKPETYKPQTESISSLSTLVKNTVIHEFSHNYLRDEYTSEDRNLNNQGQIIIKQENEFFSNSNIQTEDTLLTDDQIDADKIKWLWPRILKIGVGKFDLEESGSNYNAELVTGSSNFEVGDFVLLRTRKLFKAAYIRFSVVSKDINNPNRLTIHKEATGPIDINDYCLGFVLMQPRWIGEEHLDYEKLVHPLIQQRINALHSPLVNVDTFVGTYEKQTPITLSSIPGMADDPVKNAKTSNRSSIIGLYAGSMGANGGYSAGVHHGSGFCIMRKTDTTDPNSFCQVCRYILADAVNPLVHPLIDASYDNVYRDLDN